MLHAATSVFTETVAPERLKDRESDAFFFYHGGSAATMRIFPNFTFQDIFEYHPVALKRTVPGNDRHSKHPQLTAPQALNIFIPLRKRNNPVRT